MHTWIVKFGSEYDRDLLRLAIHLDERLRHLSLRVLPSGTGLIQGLLTDELVGFIESLPAQISVTSMTPWERDG
jgi:hypothetical protein